MNAGIVYIKCKATGKERGYFVPNDNDYEAYLAVLEDENIKEELNYNEDTLEASTKSYELEFSYLDELCRVF